MVRKSAGILLFRSNNGNPEVLLVHPGGPFWTGKDKGAWSVPKGEFEDGEEPLKAAIREFEEETGMKLPAKGKFIALTPLRQKSGKIVYAWLLEFDIDVANIRSNAFELEWPPHSGKKIEVPEIDKAGWFGLDEAAKKIIQGQKGFLDELNEVLNA